MKLKKLISYSIFGLAAFSLSGCYTQLHVEDDDDDTTIIVFLPPPLPPSDFPPPPPPSYNPPPQKEKIRQTESPPQINDRIRDDLRNSGERNSSGKRNRR
jgi:hypothetical protein